MAAKTVCRFFQMPQGCMRGNKCKFLHSTSFHDAHELINPDRIPPMNGRLTQRAMDAAFKSWKRKIPTTLASIQSWSLVGFFEEAFELLNNDPSIVQGVIMALASEGGATVIKYTLEKSTTLAQGSFRDYLLTDVIPFLKIICHSMVLRSTLLENPLATIHNVIYGPQGARAVSFYSSIVSEILGSEDEDIGDPMTTHLLLLTFTKTSETNGGAFLNEGLRAIAEILVDKAVELTRAPPSPLLASISKTASRLNRLFDIGRRIEMKTERKAITSEKAVFVRHQQPAGGRHSNDHAEITKIQIMPTFDEIMSPHREYLPTRDDPGSELSSFHALLDRHFRLLREDTVGQLRDAVRHSLVKSANSGRQGNDGIRTFVYHRLEVETIKLSEHSGFEITIGIDQPTHLVDRDPIWVKQWWERSRRLQPDALVCITGIHNLVVYCVVASPAKSQQTTSSIPIEADASPAALDYGEEHDESKDGDHETARARFTLRLANDSLEDLQSLYRCINAGSWQELALVEFPGILLPSFQPTLLALQNMYKSHDMPFTQYLAASEVSDVITPPAPAYASSEHFFFNLGCLTQQQEDLNFFPSRTFDVSELTRRTTLDNAQAEALLYCLRTSLALIQGPPGTGESYTGIAIVKTLLAAKTKAQLGPIICVCYTNHALDQLLEQLWASGVKQIIRIGGQSKSEVLADVNLRKVSQGTEQTPAEKRLRWELRKSMTESRTVLCALVENLKRAGSVGGLQQYLQARSQKHYAEIFEDSMDEEGFQRVRKRSKDALKHWLRGGDDFNGVRARTIEELQEASPFQMNACERQKLYDYWQAEIRETIITQISHEVQEFYEDDQQRKSIRSEIDLRCLNEADVIGITTTGLAKNLDILRKLEARVLLCEEAGEVLEAHILTALLPSLEHVILIGDHQQLRPQVQNYDLSRESSSGSKYSLDLSLFERLIDDPLYKQLAIPHRSLQTQRRMHPSIARLIRQTLYPSLQDAENVSSHPEVAGMRKRLFWLNHMNYEDHATAELHSTSHSNTYEVSMVTALVSHLVRQGVYQSHEIAVLTPYLAQLFKIRVALSAITAVALGERDLADAERQGLELEGFDTWLAPVRKTSLLKALRVATVDNFQGEEAKVVIVSLVRSNPQKQSGFLKTSNRINVLLSRAQHGMYIIGNSDTAGCAPMWQKVLTLLAAENNIGHQLELTCPRHPSTPITVSTPDDFVLLSPEGGCQVLCGRRLSCGHCCPNKCHSSMLHDAVKCLEPCQRTLPGCDHSCPRPCGEECAKMCSQPLANQVLGLECGHEVHDPACWQMQNPKMVTCTVLVEKSVRRCGHLLNVPCATDTQKSDFDCSARCGEQLSCGHTCTRRCCFCNLQKDVDTRTTTTKHSTCTRACGRQYDACTHVCERPCRDATPCPPCSAPCNVKCAHSQCDKKCHEPCAPCAQETCSSACPHSKCTMPCAAPCNWLPCDKRCERELSCGHQCPSPCGEICPTLEFCQICASDDIKEQNVDYITMDTYAEIDLGQNPCVFPQCGHVITASSLDGFLRLSDFYEMNEARAVISCKATAWDMNQKVPGCPQCRGTIRNINRYGRVVRQTILAESTKKFINWSMKEHTPLLRRISAMQDNLMETRQHSTRKLSMLGALSIELMDPLKVQMQAMNNATRSSRYEQLNRLSNRVGDFLKRVQHEEQPFQRVFDLVQHVRRTTDVNVGNFELEASALQTRQSLLAQSLLFRCHLAGICDFLKLVSIDTTQSVVNLKSQRQECVKLAEWAKVSHQPGIEVEAWLYYARYCAAENSFNLKRHGRLGPAEDDQELADLMRALRKEAGLAIAQVRQLRKDFDGSTIAFSAEIDEVENMIKTSTVYNVVQAEEWKTVFEAMEREFGGTAGHWYYCSNGHPFTIGECGRAMAESSCPQCGARVGGHNHETVEGVTRADDLVLMVGNLRV